MEKELSAEVMNIFYSSKWEGNIREIKHVIERLVLVSESDIIDKEDLPEYITIDESIYEKDPFVLINDNIKLEEATELLERELIIKAYNKYKSTYKVAEKLGISQSTAYRKIKKHTSNS